MVSSKPFQAPVRKTTHLLAGGTMLALLVAAVMVARTPSVASKSNVHTAAQTKAIVLIVKNPVVTVKKTAVPPAHKAAQGLLPVVNHEDILPHHRILADQVLRSLPSSCRDNLKNFYVNYEKNPKNRGLGGESTIIVAGNVPKLEFMALIVHECGHVVDLGALRGTPDSGYTAFFDGNTPIYGNDPSVAFYSINWIASETKRPGTKDTHFISGYAAADSFENFAEAYTAFALQNEAFKKLATTNSVMKAQYDFMEHVVFAGSEPIASGQYIPGKKLPWDVTRLPFTLHAKQ